MTPGVSAGSNHVGAIVTVTASVTWPSGAPARAGDDCATAVEAKHTRHSARRDERRGRMVSSDLPVVTLTEFAEQIRRITRGSDLPLMVDADHGYGNALNVMRTVEELETSGVSALTIEDTVLPTQFGDKTETLVSIEEMLGKLK